MRVQSCLNRPRRIVDFETLTASPRQVPEIRKRGYKGGDICLGDWSNGAHVLCSRRCAQEILVRIFVLTFHQRRCHWRLAWERVGVELRGGRSGRGLRVKYRV